ncbi:DUF4136 domain-containing protein [Arsukibacterium sp.]|uniref:DUF4136 domain-containing protein n=1 Tax=Arsukibacterium sp. TaxID=1977258 RepID=UPI002FD9A1F6
MLIRTAFLILLSVCLLSACASGPKLRSDQAANVDFSRYQTFGFVAEPATDKAGYSTLVTQHFKQAIREQMQARGYRYSDTSPDLLVNFNSNTVNRSEVRSTPGVTPPYGYYHYRRGYYSPFMHYRTEVETVHYKVGTVNIDVVDAAAKQLIWEGLAEGTLTDKALQQPQQAIQQTVQHIFSRYPLPAAL